MSFRDHFSDHADLYASARPTYPDALFDFVAAAAPARDLAWDCATGNGQAAVGLARRFRAVEATDASTRQIEHAVPAPGVRYSVQPAERTSFAPASFDAVCVAQALHWFDLAAFFREVRRVLRPGGAFVAWSYDWFSLSEAIDLEFRRAVLEPLEPFWAQRNRLAWRGYRDVPFPFEPIDVPALRMEFDWNLPQLLTYVRTWSATRRCLERRGPAFLDRAAESLQTVWGDPNDPRRISMRLHIRAGRHTPS